MNKLTEFYYRAKIASYDRKIERSVSKANKMIRSAEGVIVNRYGDSSLNPAFEIRYIWAIDLLENERDQLKSKLEGLQNAS